MSLENRLATHDGLKIRPKTESPTQLNTLCQKSFDADLTPLANKLASSVVTIQHEVSCLTVVPTRLRYRVYRDHRLCDVAELSAQVKDMK